MKTALIAPPLPLQLQYPSNKNLAMMKPIRVFQSKGQLISKCPFGVIVWTKIPTKKFPGFLPYPLKSGQIKKIRALYTTS